MRNSQSMFARCGARVSQRPLTLALALALGLGSTPLAGLAATISVTASDDAGTATSCTLRQAIVSMDTGSVSGTGCVNSGAAFGTSDTINFDATTFPNGAANTITLANANMNALKMSAVTLNLTIDASANGQVTIQRPSNATHDFGIIYDMTIGSLTLNHLTLSNGSAYASGCVGNHSGGGGICISKADLFLTNSTLIGNTANGGDGGGGIWSGDGNVTLTNSTLSNNNGTRGGGIYISGRNFSGANLTLNNSTLIGNTAFNGGGAYAGGNSNITLTNSTVAGNSANGFGGITTQAGHLTVTNSTVSGNQASDKNGGIYGGGIITVTNSTVTGNSAAHRSSGIGTYGGTITLASSTVTGNSSGDGSGGVYSGLPLHPVVATNSIVAGNTNNGGFGDIYPVDLASGSSGNFVGGDPQLVPLTANGGPTQTMPPLVGSPVIDAGDDAQCPATDQRGVSRPQGAHCDIGAVEGSDRIFADDFE